MPQAEFDVLVGDVVASYMLELMFTLRAALVLRQDQTQLRGGVVEYALLESTEDYTSTALGWVSDFSWTTRANEPEPEGNDGDEEVVET